MPTSNARSQLCMLVLLVAAVATTGFIAQAEERPFWPQFHGPKRDNISTETGLLKQWPAGGPKLLWTAKGFGFGYSSVVIANGMIFTAGSIGDDTVITAMDMNGAMLWQVKNGAAWTGDRPGTRGTPTIDGDHLYYEGPHGDVICLDAKTGKKIWGRNILETFHSKNIKWALAESLLIDGDRVICCPGGPEVSIVALNKQTGETVWKAASTGDLAGYASPILAECERLRIIILLTARAMIGVNANTGDLLWRFEHTSMFDENIQTPRYHDGHVYVSSLGTGTVKWKVHVEGDKARVEKIWHSRDLDNHHGDVLLLDGYLYGSSAVLNKSKWICLDASTGGLAYAVIGVGKGSLTYADGLLYTLSERGRMGIVRPTPAGHDVISSFQIPAGGEGPSWAHPVVCGGRLYLRHGEFLYAFDVRAR